MKILINLRTPVLTNFLFCAFNLLNHFQVVKKLNFFNNSRQKTDANKFSFQTKLYVMMLIIHSQLYIECKLNYNYILTFILLL